MKKYKIKKSVKILAIIIILIAFILLLKNINKSSSYSIEYELNKYDISENYDDKLELYNFIISKKDKKYEFIYNSSYLNEKKIITSIKEYNNLEESCIVINSKYVKSQPLCTNKNNNIDFYLSNKKLKEKLSKYNNESKIITKEINNYKLYDPDIDMFVWNYKGFNYIKNQKIENINIFKKDIYDVSLATKINNYILIPDYEQDYNFNVFYIINIENLKVEKWDIDYDISFDSYILGTNNKSIYLVDKKNKIEYEIVPHKKKMRIVGTSRKNGVIYKNGISESISLTKLTSSNKQITYKNNYHYKIEKKHLFLYYDSGETYTQVSNNEIDKIINVNKDTVYYLSKNTIYKYNIKYGEAKVFEYEELIFNKNNMLFIN